MLLGRDLAFSILVYQFDISVGGDRFEKDTLKDTKKTHLTFSESSEQMFVV